MQDNARIFAYTTWVMMISLAIVVFTSSFFVYIADPGWVGLVALLGFGFLYLNFSYLAIRRYIRKIMAETRQHYILAFLIYLPPAVWLIFVSEEIGESRFLTLVVLAFACALGAVYGYRAGRRQQMIHAEKYRHQTENPDR